MAQHNLGTVIGFEFFRVVRTKRFWLTSLAVPLGLAVLFALVFVSSVSSDKSAQAQKDARLQFTYSDASGLVTDDVATAFGGVEVPDGDQAVATATALCIRRLEHDLDLPAGAAPAGRCLRGSAPSGSAHPGRRPRGARAARRPRRTSGCRPAAAVRCARD